MEILGPVTSGQVTRSPKEVQCQVQISIFFMHPSHPQFLTDLFQTFRVCLVYRVVQHILRFLYHWPEGIGRSWPRNAKPMGFFSSNNSDSEITRDICFIPSLLCVNASICNNTRQVFFVGRTYPSVGSNQVNWGQVTFLLITCHIIKMQLPKWHNCVPREQKIRMICNMKHWSHHVTLSVLSMIPLLVGGKSHFRL